MARISENREERRYGVSCRNAENERDKTSHFEFLLSGADANRDERDKSAQERNEVVTCVDGCAACLNNVAHCAACQGKTDERDGRSDDDGRHEF